MEGDEGGSGVSKVSDNPVDGRDHEVAIDGCGNAVVSQSLAHHGPDSEVGYVVVVHDVKVHGVCSGGEYVVDLFSEFGKVGGEDGGGDGVFFGHCGWRCGAWEHCEGEGGGGRAEGGRGQAEAELQHWRRFERFGDSGAVVRAALPTFCYKIVSTCTLCDFSPLRNQPCLPWNAETCQAPFDQCYAQASQGSTCDATH